MEIPGRAAFLRAPGSANDHDLGLFEVPDGAVRRTATTSACTTWPGRSARWPSWPRPATGWPRRGALVGASDHRVSKSLYAKDPSGIEFEVMWRVPAEDWEQETARGRDDRPAGPRGELARWGDRVTGAAAGSVT